MRREVKHQLIAGVDKSELELLQFTTSEADTVLRWKHSKEFEYNGSMYDIVEFQKEGDTLKYWCWWDYEETVLNKQLSGLLAKAFGKDPQRKERQNTLDQFFKSLYHNTEVETSIVQMTNLKEGLGSDFVCISAELSPPVPPPRLAA